MPKALKSCPKHYKSPNLVTLFTTLIRLLFKRQIREGLSLHKVIDLFFLIGPTPASFLFIFGLLKQTLLQFLKQINVKKCHVHPVYGTGIRTHNLWIVSLLPQPLDQGSRPKVIDLSIQLCNDQSYLTLVGLRTILNNRHRVNSSGAYLSSPNTLSS